MLCEESVVFADGVADSAVGFLGIGKELESALGSGRERFLVVTEVEAVERGVAGDDGALEGGDGLGDHFDGDLICAPSVFEKITIFGIDLQPVDDAIEGMRHLDGIGDGPFGLVFERGRAAVPELKGVVGGIDDGGSVAGASFAADAEGDFARVAKRELGRVAGGAGDGAIGRELRVVIKTTAKGDGFASGWIVGGDGDRAKSQRNFDGDTFTDRQDCVISLRNRGGETDCNVSQRSDGTNQQEQADRESHERTSTFTRRLAAGSGRTL